MDGLGASACAIGLALAIGAANAAQPVEPVPFTSVRLDDSFWRPRLDTNRSVTVRYCIEMCERTGRIRNFAIAGGLEQGAFEGIFYNDSDVYKVIEGASYALHTRPDQELDAALDGVIAKIAAAQEDDGYLYTIRSIEGEAISQPAAGPARWSHLAHSHELYNVGHLYEAAVAHHQATGKRTLLDVALRNADLVCRTFGHGEGQIIAVPGHQEIEIGLVKLFRLTNDRRYLDTARFFVDMRGRADLRELYGEYAQDHIPVVKQAEPVGHAVRAGYLYAGMADLAALTDAEGYAPALDRIWNRLVSRRMYLTAGIGAHRHNEGFGDDYDLPNADAYNETCAAIALSLWAHRMFLLHAEARYMDVFERALYNGFLAGVSLSGDRFFYPNPLACDGTTPFNQGSAERAPWFDCSCCPVNVVRFIPSIPGYVYATRGHDLYVNLYASGTADVAFAPAGGSVRLTQETLYPWDGRVRIRVDPDAAGEFTLRLRIPDWARGRPVPSDLYRYINNDDLPRTIRVNGQPFLAQGDAGYALLTRTWSPGDTVELDIPMAVRRVRAHGAVKQNHNRVAFERGPIVYCFEGADNDGSVADILIPPDAPAAYRFDPSLLGGVGLLDIPAERVTGDPTNAPVRAPTTARAIPYYAWAHRGPGPMSVWVAADESAVEIPKPSTTASRAAPSASHCFGSDTLRALNDQRDPASSDDHAVPRFTWWPRKGSTEWVEYAFDAPTRLRGVAVYWFDDTGQGQCRTPASWRVLARADGEWREVPCLATPGVGLDAFQTADFASEIECDALRVEAALREGFSGGILEWRLN